MDIWLGRDECDESETNLNKKDTLILNKIMELQKAKADHGQIGFYVDMF